MNAIRTIVALVVVMFSFNVGAQTPATVPTSADLPKELKGKWGVWGRNGTYITGEVVLRFSDLSNSADIKGTESHTDRNCPATSTPTPFVSAKFSGGMLEVEIPIPEECIKNPALSYGEGARSILSLHVEKNGSSWTAKGKGVTRSAKGETRPAEIELVSP